MSDLFNKCWYYFSTYPLYTYEEFCNDRLIPVKVEWEAMWRDQACAYDELWDV